MSIMLTGCEEKNAGTRKNFDTERKQTESSKANTEQEEYKEMVMKVQINEQFFNVELENNPGAEAFYDMLREESITIHMRDYAGFEKVGTLGRSLPTQDRQTTTQPGDIVLYNGNQIVIFYGSNSWSYTRLGKIQDLTGLEKALGTGNIEVTFTIE